MVLNPLSARLRRLLDQKLPVFASHWKRKTLDDLSHWIIFFFSSAERSEAGDFLGSAGSHLMARYEHLPIYKEAFDLALYFEKTVRGMSRYDNR
jgi:hypothetical protein